MDKLGVVLIMVVLLSGCRPASYDELRLQATQAQSDAVIDRNGPIRLANKILDRFANTRPLVFGVDGDLAFKHRDIFHKVVSVMPRGALFERSEPEFLFKISVSYGRNSRYEGRHFVFMSRDRIDRRSVVDTTVTLQVIAVRQVARGGQVILSATSRGACLNAEAVSSSPPTCDRFIEVATRDNLGQLMR